jgi:hypothetical protein
MIEGRTAQALQHSHEAWKRHGLKLVRKNIQALSNPSTSPGFSVSSTTILLESFLQNQGTGVADRTSYRSWIVRDETADHGKDDSYQKA